MAILLKTGGFAAAAGALLLMLSPLSQSRAVEGPPVLKPGFERGRETGLPIPRFVSLRARRWRMRIGPSVDYATRYIYVSPGLPLEITEEYGHWRRVRDSSGTSGWMYGVLLSGTRTAIVGPWLKQPAPLRSDASAAAGQIAALSPDVRVTLSHCDGTWCRVTVPRHDLSGYIRQQSLWGAYPGEIFG